MYSSRRTASFEDSKKKKKKQGSSENEKKKDEGNNWWLYVIIAVASLFVICAAIGGIIWKQKQNANVSFQDFIQSVDGEDMPMNSPMHGNHMPAKPEQVSV